MQTKPKSWPAEFRLDGELFVRELRSVLLATGGIGAYDAGRWDVASVMFVIDESTWAALRAVSKSFDSPLEFITSGRGVATVAKCLREAFPTVKKAVGRATEDEVVEALRELTDFVRGVDRTSTGKLRVLTVFEYPDGSSVDVFVDRLDGELVLSDLGQTIGWVFDLSGHSWRADRVVHERALLAGGVREVDGAFVKEIDGVELATALGSLCQTCMRLAELEILARD
jgi:hypothetical protein